MADRNTSPEVFKLEAGTPGKIVLSGEVEKVLFENADQTYCVIQLREQTGVLDTVVGDLSGARPGEKLTVTGKWETHKDYGRQFRADSFEMALPVTQEGLIRYLSSGIVKGLGEKNASAIVNHFGDETIYVIENAPKRILEVSGVGKKRIEELTRVWNENAKQRELQMHFQSCGVSPAYFKRIVKTYGERSAEILHHDPYRLARDVSGIGFRMADQIAGNLGIGKTDSRRMLAGIDFALDQMKSLGHVCMPEACFIDYCENLLEAERSAVETALKNAVAGERVILEKEGDGVMVYEPEMLRYESALAKRAAELFAAESPACERMQKVPEPEHAQFSGEQLRAVQTAIHHPVSIITGGPGVGKTTVVSEIVRRAKAAKLRVMLAAPTGRAAKRMSETTHIDSYTIHRLLKWEPVHHGFQFNAENPLPCDLLIVDEASMLDLSLASALFESVSPGTAFVIVGDSDQLPSVGPGTVLNDLISFGGLPVTRLTKIFRQGPGSGIIHAAHAVNNGEMPQSTARNGVLTDFYWIEKEDPETAAEIIERLVSERIPKRFGLDPMTDIQVLSPMNKGVCGTIALNQMLQDKLNHDNPVSFIANDRCWRAGDKVMQTANNYDKGVFNGDMGRIVKVDLENKTFTVAFESMKIEYAFAEADQLSLSYAVTIHKSQGSEFPAVVIPLVSQHFMMLQRNLLYTGMTRAKRLMILVGAPKAVSMAVNNAGQEPRYSRLRERLQRAFAQGGLS